jgi:polyhydroxyalkanoate synthesis regulator phasin
VASALAALLALVEDGVDEGRISEKAAGEIGKDLDEALKRFEDGNAEDAIAKLDDLESKIDGMIDHDEVAHSEEQQLDRALEDLAEAMFLAGDDGDD